MSTQTGVYVKDKNHGWLPANVVSYDGGSAIVNVFPPDQEKVERKVKLSDYEGDSLPLQNIDEGGNLITMADMCDLPSLHEVITILISFYHSIYIYSRFHPDSLDSFHSQLIYYVFVVFS